MFKLCYFARSRDVAFYRYPGTRYSFTVLYLNLHFAFNLLFWSLWSHVLETGNNHQNILQDCPLLADIFPIVGFSSVLPVLISRLLLPFHSNCPLWFLFASAVHFLDWGEGIRRSVLDCSHLHCYCCYCCCCCCCCYCSC